ncbi:MAG: Gfo/Idh/MocA family oxidoreductase [Chloroflexi bacterium]|nr:Gfo/Idh/MocA family oxidoreductase [Chloroflexota bacterium]
MPTDDGRLGVLLVSFSSVGGQAHQTAMYVPVLSTHPVLLLIGVADEADAPASQHALNRQMADALKLPYVPDLDAALADPRVDLVSVCCPFDRRVSVLERVAAAGKHALVDKPLALRLDECDAIERAFATHGVACVPAYHYRFDPAIRSARAAVAGGSVGLPWAVQAEFILAEGTAAWPLGELLNFGLYVVDAMRSILGLDVESVYATTGSFFYGGGGSPDDFSVLALNFQHGVVATTSVGRAPTTGHPNGYGGDRRVRVMGSHGTLVVDAAQPSLGVYGAGWAERRGYGEHSVGLLIDHLVGCIRSGQTPEVGPRDARAALQVILAARLAAAEQRVVALDESTLEAT